MTLSQTGGYYSCNKYKAGAAGAGSGGADRAKVRRQHASQCVGHATSTACADS